MNPLECQSQRGNLLHSYRREEQLQKSAHAVLRKGLMSSSSQEPSAPRGNLLHCFHLDTKNREINSRVLFSETLTRPNCGKISS